jgi:copper homeostasis protein
MRKLLVEIICSSSLDCERAEGAGADRIELCAAIELGGLTASYGLVQAALARTKLPIIAMVRPRTGGFCYTKDEFDTMQRDIVVFRELGVHGVVFGVLTEDRQIDRVRCRQLVQLAGSLQTVFHRAFDVVADPSEALDVLIGLGVTRVLTSGGAQTAIQGAEAILQLRNAAKDRIEILPGSGIRSCNLQQLVVATGVDQIHLSAFEYATDPSMMGQVLCFNAAGIPESSYRTVSASKVAEIVSAASLI